MADIFISYSKADRDMIVMLAAYLGDTNLAVEAILTQLNHENSALIGGHRARTLFGPKSVATNSSTATTS